MGERLAVGIRFHSSPNHQSSEANPARRRVGTHRRALRSDVVAYREREKEARKRVLDELAAEGSLIRNFEHRIPLFHLPDSDDRHVLAASVEEGAKWIVTWNGADFPKRIVEALGISIVTPYDLMTLLLGTRPADTRAVVRETRLSLTNPPKSIKEYLEILKVRGMTTKLPSEFIDHRAPFGHDSRE